jgi:uncharacterized protein YcfJ
MLFPESRMASVTCHKEIIMGYLSSVLAIAIAVFILPGDARAGEHRAGSGDTHYESAVVTDVQPIFRIVQISTPREVCWNEPVRNAGYREKGRYRSHTPTLAGGIIGGVVGNQFGGGRGRTAMTVAGTLLGASVGRDAGYRHRAGRRGAKKVTYSSQRRCEIEEVLHEEERLDGYRVTYAYHGSTYVTRTEEHPGRNIKLRVQVNPVDYY